MRLLQNAASKKAALGGSMLCIDPSSGGSSKKGEKSVAGFALFEGGTLVESGTIEFPEEKVVFKRLHNVRDEVRQTFTETYNLFVLEDIRGYRAQQSLIQACGVFITSIDFKDFFQPNVQTWKSIAKHWGGYVKSDEQDAIYMGYATIAIAMGFHSKLKPDKKAEIINQAKELVGYE
jgi:hypothetical protein